MSGWQRLSQTFVRPPRRTPADGRPPAEQEDYSRLTDDEKRQRIMSLDPLEKKVGIAAGALAALLGVLETVPFMLSKIAVTTTTKPVGKHCPSGLTYVTHGTAAATCRGIYSVSHYLLYLVVFLVLAIAIFVAVRFKRRSPLAFTTAITGVAFGALYILIPFVLVAGWILLRSYRTQKYGAPNAKAPRPGYVPPPGRGSSRRRPPAKRTATTSTTRKPPEPSKRYTPKAPPKPAKRRSTPGR